MDQLARGLFRLSLLSSKSATSRPQPAAFSVISRCASTISTPDPEPMIPEKLVEASPENFKTATPAVPMSKSIGIAHITCTLNNTLITLSNGTGKTITTMTTGQFGFKHSKRATPLAAETVGRHFARKAREKKFFHVNVEFKGFGVGRSRVLKGMVDGGLTILKLTDVTPVPHNGCTPPKARRV
eukprot:GILI01003223.1.p1 GENE.GILI01003223.1~~GILI01003223.1.p1  ORF type:complete len:184 (+),score=35.23 GILI01003223.1:56-607(+)